MVRKVNTFVYTIFIGQESTFNLISRTRKLFPAFVARGIDPEKLRWFVPGRFARAGTILRRVLRVWRDTFVPLKKIIITKKGNPDD